VQVKDMTPDMLCDKRDQSTEFRHVNKLVDFSLQDMLIKGS
jgi:hypothetical protein